MHDDDLASLSDRQARTAIIAAECLGFEREPDLYAVRTTTDSTTTPRRLRSTSGCAIRTRYARLWSPRSRSPPTAPPSASPGRFTFADADVAIQTATERGFTPPATARFAGDDLSFIGP
ncbi:MAG TPA: hypothetical protein VGO80_19240 [Solirubrobacteraceae bacterium]|nr:hypothetical protein [Solirubrobacteraceae bacterium]